jgi:hypothetical protein
MRKVLLMVFACVMLLGLGTSVASAQSKKTCDKSGHGNTCKPKQQCDKSGKGDKCKPKPDCDKSGKGKDCKPKPDCDKSGKGKDCKPKPEPCDKSGKGKDCNPKPEPCDKSGKGDDCNPEPPECEPPKVLVHGECMTPVPPPAAGPCAKADLVLLRDLIKGTGPLDSLVCLFLGDNSVNASKDPGGDCPGALIALPINPVIGVCLLVPPADSPMNMTATATTTGAGLPDGSAVTGLVSQLSATIGGLLKLGG